MKKFTNLEFTITHILNEIPFTRDSDEALYAQVLKKEGYDTEAITARQLLQEMANGIYPNWESVTRWRRRIQEKVPATRGKNYEKRHQYQENIRETLGYEKETLPGMPGTTP